jgi:ribosome-associated protein
VPASKSETAAVKALKAQPPKRATKAAAAAPEAEPVKKVIKRTVKKAAE